jgi:transcriptional regulator with XRE-family HTH domain
MSKTRKRPKEIPASPLGTRVRALRKARGWKLSDLAERSGVATSTLSKVENGSLSLNYDRLLDVAHAFELSIGEFMAGPGEVAASERAPLGRLSIARAGEGVLAEAPAYVYRYLCTNLRRRAMTPIVAEARARTLEEFGPLLRHEGEEIVYVLTGRVELHTELYAPEMLEAGDCAYLDSAMGHAFLNAGRGEARVLFVSTEEH